MEVCIATCTDMNQSAVRVLYVYKWATFGGVERMLLNRAHSFHELGVRVYQEIYFLQDAGAKRTFQQAISELGLNEMLRIVDHFEPSAYDHVLIIDTPEVFELGTHSADYYFECHTPYRENRRYLSKLEPTTKGILVPSEYFKGVIRGEVPTELRDRIFTVRNCIPRSFLTEMSADRGPHLSMRPVAYLGRVDNLKNIRETIHIFSKLRQGYGDRFILLVAGPVSTEVTLDEWIDEEGLTGRFIYLPPLPFHRVPKLMALVKANQGVFISSSRGESFGLSGAEAISCGIPVVLSHPHAGIVNDDESVLYQLGDIDEAVSKLARVFEDYSGAIERLSSLKDLYAPRHFLKDWEAMFGSTAARSDK